ncbi:MAG: PD40 domain-containing protein [Chloroflexi bacterium]|jgi:TolB protein|nr:PD40 domain-containing protein [Chloroflexota bacterium]
MMKGWGRTGMLLGLLVLTSMFLAACAAPAPVPLVVAAPQIQGEPLPAGRLAFVVGGDIWQWEDGQVRPLTSGERFEGPAWSPDGTRLAASLVGVNHSDLVVLSADGELLARLTNNRGQRRIQDSDWARLPAWSPDGERIAYVSDVRTYDLALWSIAPDGSAPRQLFQAGDYGGGVDRPTWAPNGTDLAVAAFRRGEVSQIEVVTPATGRYRAVTQAANGAYDPAWSPNGEWIAYTARDGAHHDIWLVHPDGSGTVQVTSTGRNRMPAWSPDGRWLAFFTLAENGFDIRVLPIPEEGPSAPAEGRVLVSGRTIEGPSGLSWGPASSP